MKLEEARSAIEGAEPALGKQVFVVAHTFNRNGRKMHLAVTGRLRRICRKGHAWKAKAFLAAFRNGARGFDPARAHSPGGSDGIFVLTRSHRPANAMMKKIFDRFLDKPKSGAADILKALGAGPDDVIPVRLVSHHMRLLGVLHRRRDADILVLVDYDATK